MMRAPRIKICGLRDRATIEAMDGLPIDEIGLVFAPSKRKVEPVAAAELIAAIRKLRGREDKAPDSVGVFVNAKLEDVQAVIAIASLDVVQLHGNEAPETCQSIREALNVKVWKVFSIKHNASEDRLTEARRRLTPYIGKVDVVLLDTAGGGTGEPFDWSAIPSYKQAAQEINIPLYVAGGLNTDNIATLVSDYEPYGLDVSSGVETEGSKDIHKIRLFVRRVIES